MHALANAASLHYMASRYNPNGPSYSDKLHDLVAAWRWAVHHPIVVIAILAVLAVLIVWGYKYSMRMPHEPPNAKATLHGTAQVLSFKQTKGMDMHSAVEVDNYGQRNLLGRKTKTVKNASYWCTIKLAVHIPGREEYVAVVKKLLSPEQRAAIQPGATVSVRVDPDDDPKNVRLDVDHPTT